MKNVFFLFFFLVVIEPFFLAVGVTSLSLSLFFSRGFTRLLPRWYLPSVTGLLSSFFFSSFSLLFFRQAFHYSHDEEGGLAGEETDTKKNRSTSQQHEEKTKEEEDRKDSERGSQILPYKDLAANECGFLGMTFLCKRRHEEEMKQSLASVNAEYKTIVDPYYSCAVYETRDPSNIPIRIFICEDDTWLP